MTVLVMKLGDLVLGSLCMLLTTVACVVAELQYEASKWKRVRTQRRGECRRTSGEAKVQLK